MKKNALEKFILVFFILFTLTACLFISSRITNAVHLNLSFEEIAQIADMIFIGSVQKQNTRLGDMKKMVFTDIHFEDVVIIHATNRSVQRDSSIITLSFAGGRKDGLSVKCSDILAKFEDKHRYLIFCFDDNKTYTNPIVGGFQGVFEILEDNTGSEFLLAAGRKAIIGADTKGITLSKEQIAHMQEGGLIIKENENKTIHQGFYLQTPASSDSSGSASLSSIYKISSNENSKYPKPLGLEGFINYIKNVALKKTIKNERFNRDGQGVFMRIKGGKIEVQNLESYVQFYPGLTAPHQSATNLFHGSSSGISDINNSFSFTPKDDSLGDLGVCCSRDLQITFEQVPDDWWSYAVFNDAMWTWNRFMDIYRKTESDGTIGLNYNDELAGWPDDDTLHEIYGEDISWGTDAAFCLMRTIESGNPECPEILESDIMFNPAYSWTDDHDLALGNSDVLLLAPIVMHELGHSWGYQFGKYEETYDYDELSVMHSYYSGIVEDGQGIHRADAYLLRRNYNDQTSILSIKDIGVESYYADAGLVNSTTDKSHYNWGDSITLKNVTVENMSYSSVSNLRIRFFLSEDRNITNDDYQLGKNDKYWYWSTFSGENYSVYDYTTTVPSDISAGTYYVGAMVTVDGDKEDDFTSNNSTSFYNSITLKVELSNVSIDKSGIISWDNNTGDVAGYNILRKTEDETEFKRINDRIIHSPNNSFTFRDKTSTPGKTYTYQFQAVKTNGSTEFYDHVFFNG